MATRIPQVCYVAPGIWYAVRHGCNYVSLCAEREPQYAEQLECSIRAPHGAVALFGALGLLYVDQKRRMANQRCPGTFSAGAK